MTERQVMEMINENIKKLKEYESKVKSRINNPPYNSKDVEEGSELLVDILRGRLFKDEEGRDPEYELLVGEEAFKKLREELHRTSNLVKLFKGDISLQGYKKKEKEIDIKFAE